VQTCTLRKAHEATHSLGQHPEKFCWIGFGAKNNLSMVELSRIPGIPQPVTFTGVLYELVEGMGMRAPHSAGHQRAADGDAAITKEKLDRNTRTILEVSKDFKSVGKHKHQSIYMCLLCFSPFVFPFSVIVPLLPSGFFLSLFSSPLFLMHILF
jgi:hypothetical protein